MSDMDTGPLETFLREAKVGDKIALPVREPGNPEQMVVWELVACSGGGTRLKRVTK